MINRMVLENYVEYIHSYIDGRVKTKFDMSALKEICVGIESILLDWTGNTYVGVKKEFEVEKDYQLFFEVLHDLLKFFYDNKSKVSNEEWSLAEYMMYHGPVYRYLGTHDSRNIRRKKVVEPIYNDIYVSWSKSEKNAYIESKLYGPVTWMKAEIKEPKFGIDIHGFEEWCEKWLGASSFITRGNEKEVVFPTVKECIIEVTYDK